MSLVACRLSRCVSQNTSRVPSNGKLGREWGVIFAGLFGVLGCRYLLLWLCRWVVTVLGSSGWASYWALGGRHSDATVRMHDKKRDEQKTQFTTRLIHWLLQSGGGRGLTLGRQTGCPPGSPSPPTPLHLPQLSACRAAWEARGRPEFMHALGITRTDFFEDGGSSSPGRCQRPDLGGCSFQGETHLLGGGGLGHSSAFELGVATHNPPHARMHD